MYKLTFCLTRRADLTRDQFQTYWLETHAPLVRSRAEALGVRRYVQVHTADLDGLHQAFQARNDGSPEPFDGVAELWFDSLDELGGTDEARQSAAAELLADERNFIDLARSPMWIGVEQEIVDTPRAAAPIIGCRDVDGTVDHLVERVGFVCGPDSRFGGGPEGTVYATASFEGLPIHFQIRRRPLHPVDRESIETDAYLFVADVDAVHARCVANGVTIFRDLLDEDYGVRDFTIELPEGQRIAFGTEGG